MIPSKPFILSAWNPERRWVLLTEVPWRQNIKSLMPTRRVSSCWNNLLLSKNKYKIKFCFIHEGILKSYGRNLSKNILVSLFNNILESRLGHELFSILPYYSYSSSLTTLLSSLTPILHFINISETKFVIIFKQPIRIEVTNLVIVCKTW